MQKVLHLSQLEIKSALIVLVEEARLGCFAKDRYVMHLSG